jgi:hypothetical protein
MVEHSFKMSVDVEIWVTAEPSAARPKGKDETNEGNG